MINKATNLSYVMLKNCSGDNCYPNAEMAQLGIGAVYLAMRNELS